MGERTEVSGEKDQRGPVRMEWCEVVEGEHLALDFPTVMEKRRVSSEGLRQGRPGEGLLGGDHVRTARGAQQSEASCYVQRETGERIVRSS